MEDAGFAGRFHNFCDLNGKWLQVNAALCDFLGYTRDELLASDAQAITLPDDLPLTRLSLQRLRDGTSKIYEIEKRYLHKQGHVVWSLVTGSPVANAEGSYYRYMKAWLATREQQVRLHEAGQGKQD